MLVPNERSSFSLCQVRALRSPRSKMEHEYDTDHGNGSGNSYGNPNDIGDKHENRLQHVTNDVKRVERDKRE